MKKIILIIIVPLLFFSCITSLKVKVDVIDRYAIERSNEYKYFKDCNTQIPDFNNTQVDSNFKNYLVKQIRTPLKSQLLKDSIFISSSTILHLTEDLSSDIIDSLKNAYNNLELKACDIHGVIDRIISNNLKALKVSGSLKFNGYDDPLKTNLGSIALSATDKVISFGTSISGDPIASLIAKAPEDYWRKYSKTVNLITLNTEEKSSKPARVNTTIAHTFFGNADIAIKMEAPGYFIVKGVRLDADEAFKASFKVLNQGIKYLAYSSGVSVPNVASGGTTDAAYNVKIPELKLKDSLEVRSSQLSINNQFALQAFLNVLFSQRETLKSATDISKLRDAVSVIKSSFDIYKKQIQ